jgi:thiol-disulfide isomerase/thioredoxin
MKRRYIALCSLALLCTSMTACNQVTGGNPEQTNGEIKKVAVVKVDEKYDENGIEFNLPEKWKESQGKYLDIYRPLPEENMAGQIVISYIAEETIEKATKVNEEADKIPKTDKVAFDKAVEELKNIMNEFKELCIIVTIDKNIAEYNKQKELFSKFENNDLISQVDNYEFYLLYNNKPDTTGFTEASVKACGEFHDEIVNFKSLINTFKPISQTQKVSNNQFEFKTVTIDGKEIDSSILKDNKLTMINIWATYCGPCIEEMPDLQKLCEEFESDGFDIIGIVSDTPDEDNEALAKEIVSKCGVKYSNIIPDDMLTNNILNNISAVPTTFFVDSEGNIIGDLLVGSKSKEEYKEEIETRLNSIN